MTAPTRPSIPRPSQAPAGQRFARTSLVVSIVLAIFTADHALRTLRDRRVPIEWFYHSDFLSPAAVYQDVVVDGYSPTGYHFSAATFVFPDYVGYFLVRAVTGNTETAVLAWEAALYAFLAATAGLAAAALGPPNARRFILPAVTCFAAAYVGNDARHFFQTSAHDLLLPVCHGGAQACTFLSLAVTARTLRAGSRRAGGGWLATLAVLSFVALFSDRLFGLYFAAPLAVTLCGARVARRPAAGDRVPLTWERIVALLTSVAAGCGAALAALKRLQGGPDDPMKNYWTGIELNGAGDRARWLWRRVVEEGESENVLVLTAAGWYAVCLLSLAAAAVRLAAKRPTPAADRGFALYQLFSVAQLTAVTGVFVLSGISGELYARQAWWVEFSRYFYGPLAAAYFGWAFLFARWAAAGSPMWRRVFGVLVPTGLAAASLMAGRAHPPAADRDYADLRPDLIRQVDAACATAGVTDGLTDYWTAKPVTLLSRHGVRARQVLTDPGSPYGVRAYHWLSNAEWYWRPPRGVGEVGYQFVLANDTPGAPLPVRSAAVVAAVGPPAGRVPVGGHTLLVYDRPADERFRRFAELDGSVLGLRYKLSRKATVRYPGNALASGVGAAGGGTVRVAEEGRTPTGVLAFGPYLRLRDPGVHRVVFRITASGAADSNATLDVIATDPVAGDSVTFAQAAVPPGFDGELPLPFR